jgi:hypothetical protein
MAAFCELIDEHGINVLCKRGVGDPVTGVRVWCDELGDTTHVG